MFVCVSLCVFVFVFVFVFTDYCNMCFVVTGGVSYICCVLKISQ